MKDPDDITMLVTKRSKYRGPKHFDAHLHRPCGSAWDDAWHQVTSRSGATLVEGLCVINFGIVTNYIPHVANASCMLLVCSECVEAFGNEW